MLISALTGKPDDGISPEFLLDMALKSGVYNVYKEQCISLQKLLEHPHGIDLGPLLPCVEQRVRTADGRIQLAPQMFLDDLPRLQHVVSTHAETSGEFPFVIKRSNK